MSTTAMSTSTKGSLAEMSDEALVHHELGLERELLDVRFRHKTGQLDDSSRMKVLRRGIARSRTIQRRRELAGGLTKNSLRDTHRSSFKPGTATGGAEAAGSKGFLRGFVDKMGSGE